MELKGTFVPQVRVRLLPRITRALAKRAKRSSVVCKVKVSSSFGEAFPFCYHRWKPLEVHCKNSSQDMQQSTGSKSDSSRMPNLSFDRLQLSDQELCGVQKRGFGRFVAREAVLDEEYWTAAWLRAEAHWESLSYMRHVDSYKRKYAEQEFYALKRRCTGRDGNSLKCFCFVTVKKEEKNVRRTVLNSVLGTLDLSIRQFLCGETYPGTLRDSGKSKPYDAHKYAYVANVCVSKFARRQGIASNMLFLATDIATLAGMKLLFVHVNADNKPAQELYKRTGFEMVEAASSLMSKDQRLLMCMDL